jgi:peptidoglycan/LPS O-acetylase OafA/YrhL
MSLGRISYLDAQRGLAILAVVFYHAYSRWEEVEPFRQHAGVRDFFSHGWLGVELFFAISGFVIYMTLLKSSRISLFAQSRYLRLAPAMLICSCIIFLSSFLLPHRPIGDAHLIDFLSSITFIDPFLLSKIFQMKIENLDNAFWSLYVEVKFYIVVAIFYFVLRDRSLRFLWWTYLFYVLIVVLHALGFSPWYVVALKKFFSYIGFQFYAWFLIGIYAYKYSADRLIEDAFRIAFLIFLGIVGLMYKKFDVVFLLCILLCVMAFILPVFVESARKFYSNRFLLFLGYISYPLYLLHQNIVTGLAIEIHQMGVRLPSFLYPLLPLFLVVLIALGVAKIEPALRSLMKSIINRICKIS